MSLKSLWSKFEYKAHQITGIQWMLNRNGGLLCDEMGLGKTIQMIGLIKNGNMASKASLLVAPVAVLEQWASVASKSGIDVVRPVGGRWGPRSVKGDTGLYMIGYEMAMRHSQLLASYSWDYAIWDEAHRLSSGNKSTEIAYSVKAAAKWLLTGTPIVNKINDIKVLLSIVGVKAPCSLNAMEPILKERVLARTMDQLRSTMPDAPPKPAFHMETLDFSTDDEAEFYKCMTGAIRKRWRAIEADGNTLEKLKLFMRLRQLSLHPQVYIAGRKKALGALYKRDDWLTSSTKFDAIKELVSKGGRWIIFCHFHTEMDMLKEQLTPIVEKVQIYSGALNAAAKEAVLAKTHGTGTEVLLVQLQSGGVGLNLQHFNKILFTGPWWTKALMDQAVGRAVRIGQKDIVHVYNIVLKEEEALNIDSYMTDKAQAKGELCGMVLASATNTV
jgi:SNF2 family DNA or RNA helicase